VLRADDVEPASAPRRAEQRARPSPSRLAPAGLPSGVRTSANTLDLRGERVDAALDQVDAFVDRLLKQGEPLGFVLHGHGTGALKSAVRSHLSASSCVERAQPAEPDAGGDALTVFWFKY
jgi:DNA mismatch repair protein MutS2